MARNSTNTILTRFIWLLLGIMAVCTVFGTGVGYGRRQAPCPVCPRPESAPMRFCEVIGSPIGGRIAIMPETPGGTDP